MPPATLTEPNTEKKSLKTLKKHLINLLLVLAFFIGLGLIAYPTASDYWNRFHQTQAISSYAESISKIDNETYERMWGEADAYNAWLAQRKFQLTLNKKEIEEYYATLQVSDTGIMSYIEIPVINVKLPIYHGTEESVLQVAVGHIAGTSLPTGGPSTHCVLSGHRGLPSARLFTDITRLVVGDQFLIQTLDETLTYEVDQIHIVLPEECDDLRIEEGKDYCTLVTCTPYGVNTHRLLVRGHRINNARQAVRVSADAAQIDAISVAPIIAIPILLILFVYVFVVAGNKKPRTLADELLELKIAEGEGQYDIS